MRAATRLLLAAQACLLAPSAVWAYRTASDQSATSDTARVRWASPVIPMRLYTDVPTQSFSSVETIVLQSMAVWDAVACSDVSFSYRGATTSPAAADGINTIEWHRYAWEQLGFPPDSAGATDLVYERNAANEWVIVEADIHLNAYDFTWSSAASPPNGSRAFAPVIVHELGHALGLLHPCEPGGGGGAPACDASASFLSTTMYPLYVGPEQASLDGDDSAGACFLYPTAPCEPACGESETCREGECIRTCGGVVCGRSETCIAGVCMLACSGHSCLAEGTCNRDSDCSAGYACQGHLCLPRGGELADLCASDLDCASGICFEGACSIACHGECAQGYLCEEAEGREVCAPELGTFGDSCAIAEDCASQHCLLGDESTAICTRRCGVEHLPCISGFECREVSAIQVCVPSGSGGCSASRRPLSRWSLNIMIVLGLILFRRRNRRA